MAHSGRQRHRDREVRRREVEQVPPGSPREFRITGAQREMIARSLRYIDDARRALEEQQNVANREIIRELRGSADEIFDVLAELEEL